MSKRKIEQVDLVLLFGPLSIGNRKTLNRESNWYLFNEYHYSSEINQSNCTLHGRKWARFSDAVYISRSEDRWREHSEAPRVIFWRVFRHGILTWQRVLDVSRFLYSWGWQVLTSMPPDPPRLYRPWCIVYIINLIPLLILPRPIFGFPYKSLTTLLPSFFVGFQIRSVGKCFLSLIDRALSSEGKDEMGEGVRLKRKYLFSFFVLPIFLPLV